MIGGAETNNQYAADVAIVIDSQKEAIEQAKQALEHTTAKKTREALESAIKEMEHSQKDLEASKSAPEKLSAALAAEQSAYQDLLKATPREYRMRRSRQGQGGSGSGQPNQEEVNQLDMAEDNTRYETESQAAAAQTAQQKEQSETMDKLKQLARRQQDLNERLRDLQTSLQAAKDDQERDEIQRQLKRLRDEERQMVADMDELRQKMDQSPNAERQAQARQQLQQTRNDAQKASQALDSQAVSEALAAGARAEEKLQNLRENLRQQSSSQFAQQLRQMRQQARDLADREEKLGQDLDKLAHSEQKSLDDSGPQKAIVDQMAKQENALTNLLAQMRNVTEQSEATEPLLSKQLYDIIRRADQSHTDNQLEVGGQLAERGFFPQASQAEQAARQSIDQLRKDVDHAADSVLGSEADALRYAQKELDSLSSQLAKDLASATNGSPAPSDAAGRQGGPQDHQPDPQRSPKRGNSGQRPSQANDAQQTAQAGQAGQTQAGQRGQRGQKGKGQSGQPGDGDQTSTAEQQASDAGGANGASDSNGSAKTGTDTLRDFARQLGASGGAGGLGENGPITGNNYVDWVERLRDVEQSVDSPDIRNELATARERVGAFRRLYRQSGRLPSKQEVQTKALAPLTLARDWVAQELARAQNERSLAPLDRDPAPDKYSEMVRKYYENLSSPQ